MTIGLKANRSMTLTEECVMTYADLSADYNPFHFDKDVTGKLKFGKLMVQGELTTGFLHALVAMGMPGLGSVFLGQNWKFTTPVFTEDAIAAEAGLLNVHDFQVIRQLAILIKKQNRETVLETEDCCHTISSER